MKIQNLSHVEVATQDIIGGGKKKKTPGIAIGSAEAGAAAFGKYTYTSTSTGVLVVAGFTSVSGSSSYGVAIG